MANSERKDIVITAEQVEKLLNIIDDCDFEAELTYGYDRAFLHGKASGIEEVLLMLGVVDES